MSFAEAVAYIVLLFVVVAGTGILTSRTAITRLTEMGLLPRSFNHLLPLLTLAARVAAVVLIVVGLGKLAYAAGWVSEIWVARYGLASLLLIFGAVLLAMTFRKNRE